MVTSVTNLTSLTQGVDVGVGVVVPVGVDVVVAVWVGVGVAVPVPVGVDVVVAVHVGLDEAVAVPVNLSVGVSVGVTDGMLIGLSVGVPVTDSGVKVPAGDSGDDAGGTVNCDVTVTDAEIPASSVVGKTGSYVDVGRAEVGVRTGRDVLPAGDGEIDGVAVGRSAEVEVGEVCDGEGVCVTDRPTRDVGATLASRRRGLYNHTAPAPATTKQPTSNTVSKKRNPSPRPFVLRCRLGSVSKSPSIASRTSPMDG
jgi:hypothetical protein